MKGIITVDIGTTSVRAILYNEEGAAFPAERRSNVPKYYGDGRVEQDPETWRTLLPEIIRSAAERARASAVEVAAISVTAQRSSVFPVDEFGRPLRPAIMWQDLRTAELVSNLADYQKYVYGRTGITISPVFSAAKMLWLKRREPELLARARKLIGVQDYALFLLTGRFVTDETFGSRTNLLNARTRTWDPELLRLFEVDPSQLSDLVPPGSIVGGLTSEAAEACGLPSGLPVVSAGGDQQCAALGLGLFGRERAVTNTGTGSYLIGHSDEAVFDPDMRLSCNISALPGAFILEAAILTTGAIYRWFRETLWNGAQDPDDAFKAVNEAAEASEPCANGLILIPHFLGAGAPHWDAEARGLFYNVSLNTKGGDFARAILEGIAIELKENLDLIEAVSGKVNFVSASGGLSRSPLFNRIQADALGRTIQTFPDAEATSLGAWIAGAVAMGLAPSYPAAFNTATALRPPTEFQPDREIERMYETKRRQARTIYAALSTPEVRMSLSEARKR